MGITCIYVTRFGVASLSQKARLPTHQLPFELKEDHCNEYMKELCMHLFSMHWSEVYISRHLCFYGNSRVATIQYSIIIRVYYWFVTPSYVKCSKRWNNKAKCKATCLYERWRHLYLKGAWKSRCICCFNILAQHIRAKYVGKRVLVDVSKMHRFWEIKWTCHVIIRLQKNEKRQGNVRSSVKKMLSVAKEVRMPMKWQPMIIYYHRFDCIVHRSDQGQIIRKL